jgi:hypothetical protein
MSALVKTQALQRVDLPIELLDPNPDNPNTMSEAEFNMLYDNFERVGFVDAVFVRKMPTGRYMIIGGHHRVEVAKLQEFTKVPCTIIDDPDFDDDQAAFQTVRMNVIRGKMTPDKFLKMYQGLSSKYATEILKEAFGFTDDQEFKRLLRQVEAGIPQDMLPAFKKAAKNVKDIDGLSKILNSMFAKYGHTLEYGYMMLDYGGRESVWLRIEKQTYSSVLEIGELCRSNERSMDSIIGGVLQMMAAGKLQDVMAQLIASTPKVVINPDLIELPTADFLAKLEH